MIKLLSIILYFSITNLYAQKVYILKQWHLMPKVSTHDIMLSTKLAQYENQHDLYLKVKEIVKENTNSYLLAEGCDNIEINEKFESKFNNWSYVELERYIKKSDYEKILTMLPLKIEVELKEKVKTFCADDDKLITESQLALSDMRAFVGYKMRLAEFKQQGDKVSFEKYAKSLMVGIKKNDPIAYAKEQAMNALEKFEKLNFKREVHFVDYITNLKITKDQVVILVIGGVHANSIETLLKEKNINTEIYTPKGYVEVDNELIKKLKEQL